MPDPRTAATDDDERDDARADATPATAIDIAAMVDLSRYPIADLSTAPARAFAQQCRREYQDAGLCILPNFLQPAARKTIADEASGLLPHAYFCDNTHNVYLTDDDAQADDGATSATHEVARRREHTRVGSVAYDLIAADAKLRQLYLWDPLKNFIAYVLGKPALHRFADVFGACSINVFVDGGAHGWHFDESEFSVILMLQTAQRGGAFEYVPHLRGRDDERAVIAKLLDGDDDANVEVLPFTEGALLIFGGRQTIHRVTRVRGAQPRLTPILCYSETPYAQNSEAVRELFWGRANADAELNVAT
ncbi:MAG: HalD/BesD family halogenase [bacterium]